MPPSGRARPWFAPHAQVAAGYPDIMPTFQNLLGEEDVLKLVAYIKSLAAEPPSRPRTKP